MYDSRAPLRPTFCDKRLIFQGRFEYVILQHDARRKCFAMDLINVGGFSKYTLYLIFKWNIQTHSDTLLRKCFSERSICRFEALEAHKMQRFKKKTQTANKSRNL